MGSVVSGLTNSLFGRGGAGTAGEAVARARELGAEAVFKPYTVTTGSGTSQYADGELQARLSAPYEGLRQGSLGAAGSLLPMLTGAITQAPAQFGGYGQGLMDLAATQAAQAPQRFSFDSPYAQQIQQQTLAAPQQFDYTPDLAGRTEEIFGQQSALLQPEFQRQATELQGRLFGTGTLGKRLATPSGGMVQQDVMGLGEAQQRTLANLAGQARQQALGEEAQRYQQALGTFGTNVGQQQQALQNLLGAEAQQFGQATQQYGLGQTAQQQALQNLLATQGQGFGQAAQGFGLNEQARQAQIANLMGAQQGMFGQAIGLAGLEDQLMARGLDAETARAAAAYGSGQMQLSPYATQAQIQQQQRGQNAGFFGSVLGGAMSGGLFS